MRGTKNVWSQFYVSEVADYSTLPFMMSNFFVRIREGAGLTQITTRLWCGRPRDSVFDSRVEWATLSHYVQTVFEPKCLLPVKYLGLKRHGREVHNADIYKAVVRNLWIYTFMPPFVFLKIKHKVYVTVST